MNLSDRIIIIRTGRIVAEGKPRELYETPHSLWAAQFLGDANFFPVKHWEERRRGHAVAVTEDGLHIEFEVGLRLRSKCQSGDASPPEGVRVSRRTCFAQFVCRNSNRRGISLSFSRQLTLKRMTRARFRFKHQEGARDLRWESARIALACEKPLCWSTTTDSHSQVRRASGQLLNEEKARMLLIAGQVSWR